MTKELKLQQFAEQEFRRNMHNLIVEDEDGNVLVFGKYQITQENNQCTVTPFAGYSLEFSNKRTALSWCVADNLNRLKLANNILSLDRKKSLLLADIYCRKTLADRSKNPDFNDLVNTKLQTKIYNYKAVNSELEKCVNLAKYLQIKGFNNETARTGLTKAH